MKKISLSYSKLRYKNDNFKFTQKELEDKERIDKLRKMEENDKIVSNLNDLITKMAESSTKEVK